MISLDIQLTLNRKFFTKKTSNHILVLHPTKDVMVEDVENTLSAFNLDEYVIENVYMPEHTKNVVKISHL